MITWMQHNRKYLVVTIWVSTIAFIGAGFVGWGQYSYGDKSGAIAKVADVPITNQQFQQTYSRLYNQYRELFKGEFDDEQAKRFGLQKQAMRELINQALLINLAKDYDLSVSDIEVATALQSQEFFYKDAVFNKEIYQTMLKQNRLTPTEYEQDLRNTLLISKVMKLFNSEVVSLESEAIETAISIADKIEYKVITPDTVELDISDEKLRAYWREHKDSFLTPKSYKIEYLYQERVPALADEDTMRQYYSSKKHNFVGDDGKLLSFEESKSAIVDALDEKTTNKEARLKYIALKKGSLEESKLTSAIVNLQSSLFSIQTLEKISSLTSLKPYMKPSKEGDKFVVAKLVESIDPAPKSFEDAKGEVLAQYVHKSRSKAMIDMASAQLEGFSGKVTDEYVLRDSTNVFDSLSESDTSELLQVIFKNSSASGVAKLQSQKMVLYRIVDQKILAQSNPETATVVKRIKERLVQQGLIKKLDGRYKTDIFVENL